MRKEAIPNKQFYFAGLILNKKNSFKNKKLLTLNDKNKAIANRYSSKLKKKCHKNRLFITRV